MPVLSLSHVIVSLRVIRMFRCGSLRGLEQAEIERAKRIPTELRASYDYYLRGMASYSRS
jgi:hypothetical protein